MNRVQPNPGVHSRRAVVRGIAWSVPVVTVAATTPAFAASRSCQVSWTARSFTQTSDPDSSLNGFEKVVNTVASTTEPAGRMEIQHWASGNTLFWRPVLGFAGEMSNLTITFTLPDDQNFGGTIPATMSSGTAARYRAFTGDDGGYSTDLPSFSATRSGRTVTLTYPGTVAGGSAGFWGFTSTPISGIIAPAHQYYMDMTFTATQLVC